MELAGRDREVGLADEALADVRRGGTRALGILGDAGIGKTALLAAIAARATRHSVLGARAVEHEREVPFGLAVDLLEGHVASGDVTAPELEGAEQRLSHLRALRAAIELLGRERPVVLLLDDLHWADDASLEFVLHLLHRPPAVPHLLVFAARPGGASSRLLDAARHSPGFAELALAPLREAASLDLLAGVRDPVVRRTRRARGQRQPAVPARAGTRGRQGRPGAAAHTGGGDRRGAGGPSRRGAHAARRRRRRRRPVRRRARFGRDRPGARSVGARPAGGGGPRAPGGERPRVRVPSPADPPRRLRRGAARVAPRGTPPRGGRARAPRRGARRARPPRRPLRAPR
jgi:hypothetical protein